MLVRTCPYYPSHRYYMLLLLVVLFHCCALILRASDSVALLRILVTCSTQNTRCIVARSTKGSTANLYTLHSSNLQTPTHAKSNKQQTINSKKTFRFFIYNPAPLLAETYFCHGNPLKKELIDSSTLPLAQQRMLALQRVAHARNHPARSRAPCILLKNPPS